MNDIAQLVVFRVGEQRFALPLTVVERIVRAVEVTPLTKGPAILIGAIDVEGSVLPVLNTHRRFQLPDRDISANQQFVIAQAGRRTVVLVVDEAEEVIEGRALDIVKSAEIAPGLGQIHGVVRLDDGLAVIQDLGRFLSLEEEAALDEAINAEAFHGG